MGTKCSSSNKNVSLYIDMPRSEYTPGEAISGVVQMLVKNPFYAVTLDLWIYGEEKTYWEKDSKNAIFVYRGKKLHIASIIPLVTYHDEVMPGFYMIPFTFFIPIGLPSSFYWNNDFLCDPDIYGWARI